MAITLVILFYGSFSPATITLGLLYFIFGCSNGTYMFIASNKSRRPSGKKMLGIYGWPILAIFSVTLICPLTFRLANTLEGKTINDLWAWIGASMILIGIPLPIGRSKT